MALAIPASPGGLGTYEFVGTTIITSLSHTLELGLATVLLMRLLTTIPPAMVGAVAALVLHLRARPPRLTHLRSPGHSPFGSSSSDQSPP